MNKEIKLLIIEQNLINIYSIVYDLIKIENFIILCRFIIFCYQKYLSFFNINKFSNNKTYYEMYENLYIII